MEGRQWQLIVTVISVAQPRISHQFAADRSYAWFGRHTRSKAILLATARRAEAVALASEKPAIQFL